MDIVNTAIIKHLEDIGIEVETINTNILKYLGKIEAVLTLKFEEQSRLTSFLKSNKPSILQVSSEANIARQTLYNNPLLKEYIEKRLEDYHQNDPYKRIEALSTRINQLQDEVLTMRRRDVNEELLKKRIFDLEEELTIKNKEIRSLNEQVRLANERKEFQDYNQSPKHIGTIVALPTFDFQKPKP